MRRASRSSPHNVTAIIHIIRSVSTIIVRYSVFNVFRRDRLSSSHFASLKDSSSTSSVYDHHHRRCRVRLVVLWPNKRLPSFALHQRTSSATEGLLQEVYYQLRRRRRKTGSH